MPTTKYSDSDAGTVPMKSKKEHVAGVRSAEAGDGEGSTPLFGGVRLEEAVTIGKSAEEVYGFWRDFSNFPRFSKQLQQVTVLDNKRSRWTAAGPAGKTLSWDASIIEDRPNELISWHSSADAEFENAGSVTFRKAPADRGTEVRLTFTYNPPAGPIGALIAKLTGKEPSMLLRQDLRRLKQLLETGEVSTIDGQPVVLEDQN